MPTSQIRIVCFDVDGTLVHHPEGKTVWQVLNERFLGDMALNRARFDLFRAGRISYGEWVALDIGDWIARGVGRTEIENTIRETLTVVDGARGTMDELRARGYRLGVVSGTLDITLELLLSGFPFDCVYTNQVFFDGAGKIVGWQATSFDVDGKARALEQIAARFGLGVEQCAFVGDHWNDLAALARAGLGVAFHPKDDEVSRAADIVVPDGPLTRLLDLFPEIEA
jgi:phosphoserine phosphatase